MDNEIGIIVKKSYFSNGRVHCPNLEKRKKVRKQPVKAAIRLKMRLIP
jgi:hypothetical protein